MRGFRAGPCSVGIAMMLLVSSTLVALGQGAGLADVSAVRGSGLGVLADNVVLFGATQPDIGPVLTVTLPATGSAAPVTATVASTLVKYGPATLFSSGPVTLSTQGTTGTTGSVTTSATVQTVNASGQELLTASSTTSTCTATEAGPSGATTVTGGTVQTSVGAPNVDGDEVVVRVPPNPAPNTTINGSLETVGDTFRYVFNEQTVNADGSITVNAVHQYLLGPNIVGDVIIGQSVCGATATGTSTTSTAAGPTTTTTTASTTTTTTTTAPVATTTTAAAGSVSGGAFGYFTSVSLFNSPPATRGPAPTVTLPAQGSATPVTATAPAASAQYGPAVLFEAGKLDVSTEGTTTPKSVRSSSTVSNPGPTPFTADSAASTCTADGTGVAGSTTVANGKLITKTNGQGDPVTTVPIPASPAPNTEIKGTLDHVGDSFRWVFNEQIVKADGSIIVNAAHQYLMGPTAVGELVIGQSRCATTATAFTNTAAQNPSGTSSPAAGTGSLARTGLKPAARAALGLALVAGGMIPTLLGRRRRLASAAKRSRP